MSGIVLRAARSAAIAVGGLVLMCAISGCGSPPVLPGLTQTPPDPHELAEYQDRFLVDGDPEALNWLLVHHVENGMTLEEVGVALGQSGERIVRDGQYKNTGGLYQTTDEGYRWGPDRKGRSVTLFFREDHLVNFDPDEIKS